MKTTDRQKAGLIRKYHTLCTKLGMTEDERHKMLADNYGVESSKDLYTEELEHLCAVLDAESNTKEYKLQEARRRVFGAVGGWLDILYGKSRERTEKIKSIACRQTGYKEFNKIPVERLNNVSYLFSKKQKDYKKGSVVADIEVERLKYLN